MNTYQRPDLFAGKIHAILQRQWKSRVKGRDYYDFVWYIARDIPVRLAPLEQRLRQSGAWTKPESLTQSRLLEMLREKFTQVDMESAKRDVVAFLRDPAAVEIWSADFFISR